MQSKTTRMNRPKDVTIGVQSRAYTGHVNVVLNAFSRTNDKLVV